MKRASRLATAVLLHCVLALVWAHPAQRACASKPALEWSAPAGCPDRAQVEARVRRLLEGAVQSNLSASAEVTQTARAYRARVRINHAGRLAERVLEHARCDVLADSVALVISLSAAADESNQRDAAAHSLRPVFSLAAHASALFGALPRAGLGIGGMLAAEEVASLRLELRGVYFFPQSTRFEPGGPGATFHLFAFGARGCRIWSLGVLDLAPCIGADLYRMAGSGFGGSPSLDGSATWWGPAFGALGRVRLFKAFGVYTAVEGIVPLTRRRFVFADVGELHRAGPISLQLIVAPEVRF